MNRLEKSLGGQGIQAAEGKTRYIRYPPWDAWEMFFLFGEPETFWFSGFEVSPFDPYLTVLHFLFFGMASVGSLARVGGETRLGPLRTSITLRQFGVFR